MRLEPEKQIVHYTLFPGLGPDDLPDTLALIAFGPPLPDQVS